jgi:aspartate 1-decarboxylase
MTRTMLKSKIHRAVITGTNLMYCGSITLDPAIIEAADLLPFEQVHVFNMANGARLVTYVIEGETRGNGEICLNGAAARLAEPGDEVIILSFVEASDEEARECKPVIVACNGNNKIPEK